MTRILILNGHPDPDPDRFVHAALRSYAEGATGAHEIRELAIGKIDFPIIRTRSAWQDEPPPQAVLEAQQAIGWAEHLVIGYPLWLGDMPALLKGFLEQVFRPGFAFHYEAGSAWPAKHLMGRSARVIVTMGMPAPVYSLYLRAHSLKSLERNILGFTGISPVRHSIVGDVEGSEAHREAWLSKLHVLGKRAK